MEGKTKLQIAAGIAMDVAGLALVVSSIPEGGWRLGGGLALLLAGTILVSRTLQRAPAAAVTQEQRASAKKGWSPEPELRRVPPRPVRLSVTAKVVAAAWLLMLAVTAGYAYFSVFSRSPGPPSQGLIASEGQSAQARVHRREVRENDAGEPRYTLYYNFADAEGAAVRSSASVSKLLFDHYAEGDRLEALYLPGDPLAHYLPALTRPAFAERGLLMGLVVAALLLYLLESRRRRHRRLVSRGEPFAGVAENVRRRGGARVFDVRYELGGRENTLAVTERNPMRREGDVVTVLCEGGDAELYRQCLYRAKA